ncbi:BspA family leucine-rich repeat surface protein [uncultured Prevotella sp.]|uniref:BspA family leucine-rich repeat surface protein n=1 Tax=uncultured Prevotella sp. TaxID=159272 RepID=UPI0027E2B359|nr:BspA family leucine-rich repeat surface protein [uncultured Prevotella sp.]
MKKVILQNHWSLADRFLNERVFNRFFIQFSLVIFVWLLMPTRMIAQASVSDSRSNLITVDDGITIESITDVGDNPWELLDFNAKGMDNIDITIPADSKGLMSSNYNKNNSKSECIIKINSNSAFVLSFDYAVSSEGSWDPLIVSLDKKEIDKIGSKSKKRQKSCQVVLNAGSHELTLSYQKDRSNHGGADRGFVYNMKALKQDELYAGIYDSATKKYTFKEVSVEEVSQNENAHLIYDGMKISDLPNYASLEKVVFEESFKKFEPTTLSSFFKELKSLTSISGLENLNTTHVTDMSKMFYNCYNLSSLNLSQFNTGNVEKMNEMFYYCRGLNSLDLSAFNTAKVNNMYRMFYYCFVRTIDLSSFNTANVENMDEMFAGASLVVNIYTSESFKTDKLTTSKYMFYLCTKLPNFNKDEVDATHANYGAGGYFKKIVGQKGSVTLGANGEPLAVAELTLTDDDEDFKAYESFIATSASYRRTLKEGTTWATLCLPFEVSLDGKNFRAFKLLSADDAKETVELEEIETNIEAGTPVIIKMKDGETKLKFSVANKAIAKDVQTSETTDGNYQLHGLYTQKEFNKNADNNCYIVKGNKLMNPAMLLEKTKVQKVASKPFRAYMVDNTSSAAGAKMFSIGFDNDGTTAIDSLNTIADDKAEYYDLQGKRLNEPQKGINIVKRGGKTMKVIIK